MISRLRSLLVECVSSLVDVRGLNERGGNLRSLFYSGRASVARAIEATFLFCDNLLSYLPSAPIHSIYPLTLQLLFAMATLQRVVISLLLIITAGFLFLAQTSSAAKGPLITNKVG